MKKIKILTSTFLILYSFSSFGSPSKVEAVNYCNAKGFADQKSYIIALSKHFSNYREINEYYQKSCGYNSLDDQHSSSPEVTRMIEDLETENSWKCVPAPYLTKMYANIFNYKRIANIAFCFDSKEDSKVLNRVTFKSRFIGTECIQYRSFRIIPSTVTIDFEFELLKSDVKEIKMKSLSRL